jgi:death-on-curing protein
MTGQIAFLSVEQVLDLHRRMIDEFGGSVELRDRGLLESAVAMPMARFGGQYLHDGLPAMAAAYLFHLCKNHPFVDGNKRTALAAANLFVLANGATLAASNAELEELTLGVASGTLSKDDVVVFFQGHTADRGGDIE